MKNKKGIKGFVAIKIDLHKAYDRINWQVLIQILDAYGFSEKFKLLVFRCLSSENLKLLLNGSYFGKIPMERGIKQGDPLSPFLFVLFLEILSRMITKLENERDIQGIKIEKLAPAIYHLFLLMTFLSFAEPMLNKLGQAKALIRLNRGVIFPRIFREALKLLSRVD